MAQFWAKARKWYSSFARIFILAGLLLTYEGVAVDIASQMANFSTSTQRSLGMSYGPSPVSEMRWVGIDEIRPEGPAARAGLRPGDGVKFDVLLGDNIVWQPGDTVGVTVARDGHRFRAVMTADAPPPRAQQDDAPMFRLLVLVLELLLAGFITFLLFRGLRNRAAALLGVSVLFWLDPGMVFIPHWAFVPLALIIVVPVKAASLYCWPVFAMEISRGTVSQKQVRRVHWTAVLLAVAFLVVTLLGVFRVPLPVHPGIPFAALYLSDLALGLTVIGLNYRRNDPAGRNRIKIVLAAFGCMFLGIVVGLALRILGQFDDASDWLLLVALALSMGLLAYAVLNKKLFDFGFAINRTLVYGAAGFTLLVAFGLVEYLAKSMIPVAWPTAGPFISAGVAVLLFLSFHRLHHWFEHHIERFFFKAWQDNEAVLKRFVQSATHFDHAPTLCREFTEEVRRFTGGAGVALFLREEDGSFYLAGGGIDGAPDHYAVENRVFAAMCSERRPIDLTRVHNPLPGELALPMLGQVGLAGFVLVESKTEGTHFRPDEVEVLGWAAHQVGLDLQALEARRLRAEVAQLKRDVCLISLERDRLLGQFSPQR